MSEVSENRYDTRLIVSKLETMCTHTLERHIEAAFSDAEEHLFELAAESRTMTEQSKFFEGRRQLEQYRTAIISEFLAKTKDSFRAYLKGAKQLPEIFGADSDQGEIRADEMRIVDDRDLAEMLTFDAMIESAEVRYTRHLFALNIRLGELLVKDPIKHNQNPLAPRPVCERFRQAIEVFDGDVEVEVALLKAFEHELIQKLDLVYDKANEFLKSRGIKPEIEYSAYDKNTNPHDTPEEEEVDESVFDPLGETVEKVDREALEQAASQAMDADARDAVLLSTIQTLLAERASQVNRDPNLPVMNTNKVLDAIDKMQHDWASRKNAGDTSQSIKGDLLRIAKQQADGPSTIGAVDEQTIDTVEMMFDFIGNDEDLPQSFQLALSKLQMPFLKRALHDKELLSNPESSAKELINAMAEAGKGWSEITDPKKQILNKVEDIVDDLMVHKNADEKHFSKLLSEFKQLQAKTARRADLRARRETEAAKGRERLKLARRTTHDALHPYLSRRKMPSLVKDLLEKSWAHVMVLTMLRQGEDSRAWEQALRTAKELIWSVSFEPTKPAVKKLKTRLPVLMKSLSEGLKQVGYSESEIGKIRSQLMQIYRDMVKSSGSDHVVVEQTDHGIVIRGEDISADSEDEDLPVIEDTESLNEALNMVKDWQPGRWVRFHRDESGPLRAKLSWISPITGNYLFVDQQGRRAEELTPQQIAAQVLERKARPISQDALVTRALDAVVSKLSEPKESEDTRISETDGAGVPQFRV